MCTNSCKGLACLRTGGAVHVCTTSAEPLPGTGGWVQGLSHSYGNGRVPPANDSGFWKAEAPHFILSWACWTVRTQEVCQFRRAREMCRWSIKKTKRKKNSKKTKAKPTNQPKPKPNNHQWRGHSVIMLWRQDLFLSHCVWLRLTCLVAITFPCLSLPMCPVSATVWVGGHYFIHLPHSLRALFGSKGLSFKVLSLNIKEYTSDIAVVNTITGIGSGISLEPGFKVHVKETERCLDFFLAIFL